MLNDRPQFNRNEILKELNNLADTIKNKITIYLIGGGSLALYELKESTKDIDVIVQTSHELKILINAFNELGYNKITKLEKDYEKIGASYIYENPKGLRWDIFLQKVVNRIILSKNMISRSHTSFHKNGFILKQLSKEDIFVFKSITEREGDLADMRRIAETGIDWETVLQEIQIQSNLTGIIWEYAFFSNLKELESRYGIKSPIMKKIENILTRKLEEKTVLRQIQNGKKTVKKNFYLNFTFIFF